MLRLLLIAAALAADIVRVSVAAEVIGFDTYPDGSAVPAGYSIHDQWTSLGVLFTMGDSTRAAYAVPHDCSLSAHNHVGGDPVGSFDRVDRSRRSRGPRAFGDLLGRVDRSRRTPGGAANPRPVNQPGALGALAARPSTATSACRKHETTWSFTPPIAWRKA